MTTQAEPGTQENFPDTPTLDRIHQLHQQSEAVGEFIEWLGLEGYTIAVPSGRRNEGHRDCLDPAIVNRNDLLHRFFGISQEQEDAEREMVLEHLRNTNRPE